MNIVAFFRANNLDPKGGIKESNKKKYVDSDMPVHYIKLNKELDNGQNHLVLSRSLAEDIMNDVLEIKQAVVNQNNEGIYGLIRPDTCKVVKEFSLWED